MKLFIICIFTNFVCMGLGNPWGYAYDRRDYDRNEEEFKMLKYQQVMERTKQFGDESQRRLEQEVERNRERNRRIIDSYRDNY